MQRGTATVKPVSHLFAEKLSILDILNLAPSGMYTVLEYLKCMYIQYLEGLELQSIKLVLDSNFSKATVQLA